LTDVGVKGVRDAKESVSCEVWVCKMVSRRSGSRSRSSRSLNGRGAYKACRRRLRRVLVRWSIPVYQAVVISPV